MRLLRFHPRRLTPSQIEQLFLVAEHRFDRPTTDLARPGLTWRTGAIIRHQIQIGPLGLVDAHPRQPYLPDPRAVEIRPRDQPLDPPRRPVVQLAPQRVDPLA